MGFNHADFLSREQEIALLTRWIEHRDYEARKRLVAAFQPLVIKIASRFRASEHLAEDLCQEGSIGLLKALDRFDLSRGVVFATYASYWVRAEMVEWLLRQSHDVRGSSSAAGKAKFFKGEDAIHVISLDAAVTRNDEVVGTVGDNLISGDPSPEELTDISIQNERLRRAFHDCTQNLSKRNRDIARSRLLNDEPPTFQVLAERHGISRERVRQIEQGTVELLRKKLRVPA